MSWKVLIAHSPGEESFAEILARPIRAAGYEVLHRDTIEIGESIELETSVALESGGPVVLCGTARAVGSRWAWQLVDAARSSEGRQRIFVVQMEKEAYVEPLARGGKIARYWENSATAIQELIEALQKHYPLQSSLASPEWPQNVLVHLSTRLSDDYDSHMRAGEDIPVEQASARYIQEILRIREKQGENQASPGEQQAGPVQEGEDQTNSGEQQSKPVQEGTLADLLATKEVEQLLVIGAGGCGKTTMLKRLASDGARRAAQDTNAPAFVYFPLPGFDRPDGGFDLLLDRLSLEAHLSSQEFRALWQNGRRPITFLLDGLNEVARAYQDSCIQALHTLLQKSPPFHRYVITARPGGEYEAMSGYLADNRRLRIADVLQLKPQQVREYLKSYGLTGLESRIVGELEDLAGNPFLLWAMTRTLADLTGEAPRNRGGLFKALIDDYIFTRREKNKPPPRPTDYNYERVKKPVLARLALSMTDTGVTTVRNDETLLEQVDQELAHLQKKKLGKYPLEAKTFMPENPTAFVLLREIVENGVLVQEGERLRFMHESIQEYFTAAALDSRTREELLSRFPRLRLSRLDQRGPMFETLITLAGMSTLQDVPELVRQVQDWHPLLAAHMAKEAGLPEKVLQSLRDRFISLTSSDHEQQRRLGAMGLAILPSEDAKVAACLIKMVEDEDLKDIAQKTLKALHSKSILTGLVDAWLTHSRDGKSRLESTLQDMAGQQRKLVAEVLVDAWVKKAALQDRVAELAALLESKAGREQGQPGLLEEALLIQSVEAELGGDVQKSGAIDALARRMKEGPVSDLALEGSSRISHGLALAEALTRFDQSEQRQEKLTAAYADQEDAELERYAREGVPEQQRAALDTLVRRRSKAGLALLMESVLRNPTVKNLGQLALFPRERVQECLEEQIARAQSRSLEHARILKSLLADTPASEDLEKVFGNSGPGLRAYAAGAAAGAGAQGIRLLIEELKNEVSEDVLVACIRALAGSNNCLARRHLLRLLFDPAARQHWPARTGDVMVKAGNRSITADGWAALIHYVLEQAGWGELILKRLKHLLYEERISNTERIVQAVQEAHRLPPDFRVCELLERAMDHREMEVRIWAQWSLACLGRVDAWNALLQTGLGSLQQEVLFLQDIVRRIEIKTMDPAARDPFILAARAVLQSALVDPDPPARRVKALEIIRFLPEEWISSEWREDILAAAEMLLASEDPHARNESVRSLHRFKADEQQLLRILFSDPDGEVIRTVHGLLGDLARQQLEDRLHTAIEEGNVEMARHAAGLISRLFRNFRSFDAILNRIAERLESTDRQQCVTALIALLILYPRILSQRWAGVMIDRAHAAFQRHGLEATWRQFLNNARSTKENGREFIYSLLYAFVEELEQFESIIDWMLEYWPDDRRALAARVGLDIHFNRREQAAQLLLSIQERFMDRINHDWLGDQFAAVERPQDALRHYSLGIEQFPGEDQIYFKAGWLEFEIGDFKESIRLTRQSLELRPAQPAAEFNLGVALLACSDIAASEYAYQRGSAMARRMDPANARFWLQGALDDFALLPDLPDASRNALGRIRTRLEEELAGLEKIE